MSSPPPPSTAYTLAPLVISPRLLRSLTTNSSATRTFAPHFKVEPDELSILRDRAGGLICGKTEYVSTISWPEGTWLSSDEKTEAGESVYPPPETSFTLTPLGMSRRLLSSLSSDEGARKTFAFHFEREEDDIWVWRNTEGVVVAGRGEAAGELGIFKKD
ncbi:hypothetical protein L198_06201 [Cryptococcus wingfieldii CBS 7118]|uniref:Uncharacterized protein n=1 Tax=Cryptococcus wingfieldii CBS 7118 TaxID=1295528 RepID=A0A1E3INK3_9TREE|nr:hypothetical protein L198_06201 [Cryptococcus wingfieldii CBS 7118]ODN90183.1 hypothetical protein L198_06201 [Cryptococcus wingfieldii CBS 7118]